MKGAIGRVVTPSIGWYGQLRDAVALLQRAEDRLASFIAGDESAPPYVLEQVKAQIEEARRKIGLARAG